MAAITDAPNAQELAKIGDLVFKDILQDEFRGFRENQAPVYTKDNKELCPEADISKRLEIASTECGKFLEVKTLDGSRLAKHKEVLNSVTRFHSDLMEIQPLKDNPENPVVNRTIAAVVLESQLGHCFMEKQFNLEVDAKAYKDAVAHSHEFASLSRLSEVVKDIVGPAYDVHNMNRYRAYEPGLNR